MAESSTSSSRTRRRHSSSSLGKLREVIRSPGTEILRGKVAQDEDGRSEHRLVLSEGKRRKNRIVRIRFEEAVVIPVRFQGTSVSPVEPPA
jgi:hypothetical protein